MADEFKYDVAFSFLSQDESLADQLADTLEGRLRIFHYARRQDVVAGTDGEATFNRVFGSEARIVVVLYRAGWGERGMTQVEQTAIRNRAYETGYDFTLWIPLGGSAVPPWVPKARIWLSLERWGINGAASVIEARATECGALLPTESAVEKAARLQRVHDREEQRVAFLHSQAGVNAAQAAVRALQEALSASTKALEASAPMLRPHVQIQGDRCALRLGGVTLTIAGSRQFSNSLRYATLHVMVWPFAYSLQLEAERRPAEAREYEFDLGPGDQPVWRWRDDRERGVSSSQLADQLVTELLDVQAAEGEE